MGIKEIYTTHQSNEKARVHWMIMPKGYAYSERKYSQATIILVEVDSEIEQKSREDLMQLLSKFLLDNFNISPLELVLSVANTSFINQYANSQRQRVHPLHRWRIRFKAIITSLTSKLLNGYSQILVTN